MVRTKGLGEKPKQPKFNRATLLIAAAALGLVVLGTAGWLITREIVEGPRVQALREVAPLMSQLTQDIDAAIVQTQIALEEVHIASEGENLDAAKLHLHRFLNVLVGQRDRDFDAQAGNPGDNKGVLTHVEDALMLLDDTRIQGATAALGAPLELKRQQASSALENARADVLGSLYHTKGALKANTLEAARQDIQGAIGWLNSAVSDIPETNEVQLRALHFAQARLREIARAVNPKG